MSAPTTMLALLLSLLGCAALYLSSPHQRWRAAPLSARPARAFALLSSAASLVAFTCVLHPVPAVFTHVSWTMLLLVALPYLGAFTSKVEPRGAAARVSRAEKER